MKKIKILIGCCFIFAFSNYLFAQGDGPRAYMPLPVKKSIITPMYTNVQSNQMFVDNPFFKAGADFNTNIYSAMFTHVFDIKGHSAAAVGVLSYGHTSGSGKLKSNFGSFSADLQSGSASGLTDFYGIVGVNLIGAPSFTPKEYMQYKYDFIFDVQFAFKAPIGQYDKDKLINMGTNRWEFKVGFPTMKYFNWGTTHLTSLEVLPSISFFTNNGDIPDGNTLKEKPRFNLEGHVTQNINQMLWASLDGYYVTGGATEIDHGGYSGNTNAFELGGTLGASFSKKLSGKITYGGVVAHNDNGMDGQMWRFCASYLF